MEKQKQSFSCYIIGNDTLTMHCASLLIEKNHYVLGIISASAQIKAWCKEHQVPHIHDIHEFEQQHNHTPFDYLFSIVNDVILPEAIIRAPRVHAINYHNSPLPKYAGLYATSWAILNNESEHAISWHIIEPKIDSGAIVKQLFVAIDSQDTALTLNLKCYEAAIESFSILVDELASNIMRLVSQNLDQRSYYGLKNKPKNWGFVNWNSSADEIDRLCRALSLGAYRNELATPKLFINNQYYIIHAHRMLHVTSKGEPGTIVHLSKNEAQITTNTVDIAILSMMDTEGVLYDMEHWSTLCSLSVGQTLPLIHQPEQSIKAATPQVERFWVKQYLSYIHQDLSFLNSLKRTQRPDLGRSSSLVLPHHISHQLQLYSSKMAINPHDILCTVVLIYLYRLNNYKNYSLHIKESSQIQPYFAYSFFVSDTYPLTMNLSHDLSFTDTLYQIANELLRLKQQDTFCSDLFVRYPELQLPLKDVLIRFIDKDKPLGVSQEEYKLIISIEKNGSGLHIHNKTNYQENECSYAFFNHIEEHLNLILEDALAHPEKKLYELSLLSPEELGLMHSWNSTDRDYDTTLLLQHEIEQQALKNPQRQAVSFEGQTISFELLDKKANQLAHYLQHQGVQPNDSIGVHLHRSLDMVISILGILKSGAAYLPLDPHYPSQRIQYILTHSKTHYLISDEPRSSQQLSDYTGIIINPSELPYHDFDVTKPSINTLSKDLAYIIYTSGTTGKPKGVAITHQSACNHMMWMNNAYDFNPNDRFLLKTPFSFDASVWEIFMPLIVGGLLVIAPNDAHTHPKELIDLIVQHHISIIQLVPSMLREMTLTHGFDACLSLRHVFCGGESLLPETIHGFYEHNTFEAQLHNLYGPTEATIDAVTRSCTLEDCERHISLIGTPIYNTKAYILDRFSQQVPAGILGELYLSGDGLAQGYLHNPQLTKQKFIPNPFNPTKRLYRTGDLVKWCRDGSIEYHGRADEQIKIRGFRIEISEIESCLEKIHAVYQCLVKPEHSPEGAVYLSAYLVLVEHTKISAHELRTTLKKELPDYMIPSRFFIVEQLLFTPNGKLDRKHTPIPIHKLTLTTEQHQAPETTIQKQLHKIWVSILNNAELGIHDDFFELGGHSLLAMQIISRIHEVLSIKLSIRALFDYPNIDMLSQELERARQINSLDSSLDFQTIIPLKKSGHKTPLFLIHPVGGSVFWYTALAKHFDIERPLYGIQDPGLETQTFLFTHLEEMASCYIDNIKRIQPHGAYLIGGASFGATVAIEIAKQLQNQDEEVEAIISLDGWAEYPALQSSEAHFKVLMQEQNTRLIEQYRRNNLQQADFLLDMQWQREQMLMRYTLPRIKAPLILFKANHLSPLFKYDAPLNWWDQYADLPITCYLTPGDHETMFYDEHSKVLAQYIHHSLMDKNNE